MYQAVAAHRLGHETEARKALGRLRELAGGSEPELIAIAYAWLGDRDHAFEWLERALGAEIWGVKFGAAFRTLHDDPRWKPFLRKMNLPVD